MKLACEAVRDELLDRAAGRLDIARDELTYQDGWVSRDGESLLAVAEAVGGEPIEAVREFHTRPTYPLDASGQGDANVSWGFAAHRAVVEVDVELGLVRVVEIATAQDVGLVPSTRSRSRDRSREASRKASASR